MAKDLIIGGASNYKYDDVKYWINSIKKSGFDGDIVLVATNMKNDELAKVAEQGVNILVYGQRDAEGNFVNNGSLAPHVERFFYIWNYLSQCEPYRYVVTTDVRDVVFQSNPIAFMENLNLSENFIAAGEGLKYNDEPWGIGNYELAFGPFFQNRIKDVPIYNVGILAGKHKAVTDMLLMIYQLSINRRYEIVDQAVYNFILSTNWFAKDTLFMANDSAWAVNLGTTIHAVESGHGDLGYRAVRDTNAMEKYKSDYLCKQPSIIGDIVISPETDKPYVIVHQYDRVNGLADLIRKRFDA